MRLLCSLSLSLSLSSLTLSPSDSLLFSLSIAARFPAQQHDPRNKKTHRKTLERRGWGLRVARVWQRLQVRTHSVADFSSFFLIVNGGFQLSHLRAVEQMGGGEPNKLQLEFFLSRVTPSRWGVLEGSAPTEGEPRGFLTSRTRPL